MVTLPTFIFDVAGSNPFLGIIYLFILFSNLFHKNDFLQEFIYQIFINLQSNNFFNHENDNQQKNEWNTLQSHNMRNLLCSYIGKLLCRNKDKRIQIYREMCVCVWKWEVKWEVKMSENIHTQTIFIWKVSKFHAKNAKKSHIVKLRILWICSVFQVMA